MIILNNNGKTTLEDIVHPSLCSAGTGSFFNQTASRMNYSIEEFSNLALQSTAPENISGTCAVFANSDMINAQQKGAGMIDIIAGLHKGFATRFLKTISKGKVLEGPFSFQGGLAENPGMKRYLEKTLTEAFGQGGGVKLIIPENFRHMGAVGAAVIASKNGANSYYLDGSAERIQLIKPDLGKILKPLTLNEKITIRRGELDRLPETDKVDVYLGVDIGSVSTNIAVLQYEPGAKDNEWKLLAKRYLPTQSNPIGAVTRALKEINQEMGDRINVLDAAVTGSGRYLIADYLGGVRAVNEITAHKRGSQTIAERIGLNVDEIFEIGGQDSKYVRLSDGLISYFDMNKSCAAGTGSFIEEIVKQLGVKIEDFAGIALNATEPRLSGNQKCTVFMEEEIANRQAHMEKSDLLATIADAMAKNYLNQFRIGDRTGQNIFFQGGVALNHAVVSALQQQTGANIIVPEHNEVMGAIGAAIVARQNYKEKTKFSGFDTIDKRNYQIESFECLDCESLCNVSKVTTSDGLTLHGGDRCEKYSLETGQKTKRKLELPDLFRERTKLLRANYRSEIRDEKVQMSEKVIGIPKVFAAYYDYFPMFKAFFEDLGFKVVTSKTTNKKIADSSLENVLSECCFPAEITYGHLKDLQSRGVDYIFFPSIVETLQTEQKERKTYLCTLSMQQPFAAPHSMKEFDGKMDTLIRPVINMHSERYDLDEEMIRVAEKLGKGRKKALKALGVGLRAQRLFQQKVRDKGKEIMGKLDEIENPVAVIARSYTAFDKGINVDLPKMIIDSGGYPIPVEFLGLEGEDISDKLYHFNWTYGQKILRAAEIIRKDPRLNSIYFSTAFCGPDAFLEDFYKESLGGKAHLGIEVGKNTPPAHVLTRVEAFLDSIAEQRLMEREYAKSEIVVNHKPKKRKLLISRMMSDSPIFAKSLELLGVEAEALPESTPESLELANRLIPLSTCLPTRMTAGDFLAYLQNGHRPGENIAFFNFRADGACRQDVYSILQEIVLRRLGHPDIPVVTPQKGSFKRYTQQLEAINGGLKITDKQIRRFYRVFWKGIAANEMAEQLVFSRRPYERVPGSIDEAFAEGQRIFIKNMLVEKIGDEALKFIKRIGDVPADTSQDRFKVGIVGEIYVRLHTPSNYDAIRELENLGAVCTVPMIKDYLSYTFDDNRVTTKVLTRIKMRLLRFLMDRYDRKITKDISDKLIFHEPKTREIMNRAKNYVDTRIGSESIENIGIAQHYQEKGLHGVLSLIPAYCMPGGALQSYLHRLHEQTGIPVLTMPLDGIQNRVAFRQQLEIFAHKAKKYQEKATA
jgi:predicted CoA-substrate-specific enzyme activase